jgi:hypothetical protein
MIEPSSERAPESETVRQSVGHVVHDIITLVELQGQLFESDAREVGERIARPVIVFAAGTLLFVATVPVCLLTIAEGLVASGVSRAAAYALVAVTSMVAAAGMAAWAWQRFRRMPSGFVRSYEELTYNWSWIKESLNKLACEPAQPREEFNYDRFQQRKCRESEER